MQQDYWFLNKAGYEPLLEGFAITAPAYLSAMQELTQFFPGRGRSRIDREPGFKGLIIENVPARVCRATGERLFAPETVERLQKLSGSKES